MIDLQYTFFERKVRELIGIDLSSYKSEQMRRRLNSMMARAGARNLFDYYRLLAQSPERRQEFRDFVTINVSEFFRIPEKFEYLAREVLPDLLSPEHRLSVWSAGCSNGAEPYSLAIVLDELAPRSQWRIVASDIDATILEYARRGVYSPADVRNLSARLLNKYFAAADNRYQLVDRIKSRVQFKVHDLVRAQYEKNLDLIVCRHVLIYFTEEAKDEILQKFHDSLRPGGVLFVGGTETIKRPKQLGFEVMTSSFYRKVGEQSHRTVHGSPSAS